jgi:hypothetical protein
MTSLAANKWGVFDIFYSDSFLDIKNARYNIKTNINIEIIDA